MNGQYLCTISFLVKGMAHKFIDISNRTLISILPMPESLQLYLPDVFLAINNLAVRYEIEEVLAYN